MTKIAKPQLHGLAVRRTSIWLASAIVSSILSGLAFEQFFINKKKRVYKAFYENYDINKEFETMREKGLFDSC